MVTMDCGVMEAGEWKLRYLFLRYKPFFLFILRIKLVMFITLLIFSFAKNDSANPYLYEISLLFLPPVGELSNLGAEPARETVDLLNSMWTLGISYIFHIKLM